MKGQSPLKRTRLEEVGLGLSPQSWELVTPEGQGSAQSLRAQAELEGSRCERRLWAECLFGPPAHL